MSKLDDEFDNLLNGVELPSDDEINEETRRAKISTTTSGTKVQPESMKHKLSAAKRNVPLSEDHCKSLRVPKSVPAWNKNIPRTDEQKEHHSKKMTGKPAWNKNIPRTDEQKEEQSRKLAGRPSPKKGVATGKPSHNSGKSIYIFITPLGEFNSMREVINAYPDKSVSTLKRYVADAIDGFSRRLK